MTRASHVRQRPSSLLSIRRTAVLAACPSVASGGQKTRSHMWLQLLLTCLKQEHGQRIKPSSRRSAPILNDVVGFARVLQHIAAAMNGQVGALHVEQRSPTRNASENRGGSAAFARLRRRF